MKQRIFSRVPFYGLFAILILFAAIILLSVLSISVFAQAQILQDRVKRGIWKGEEIEYVDRQVSIKVKPGVGRAQPTPAVEILRGRFLEEIDVLRWTVFELCERADVFDAVGLLEKNPFFELPGGSIVRRVISELQTSTVIETVAPSYLASILIESDGPLWHPQWRVVKKQFPDVWNITRGVSATPVGILNTGLGISHPDLSSDVHSSLHEDLPSEHDLDIDLHALTRSDSTARDHSSTTLVVAKEAGFGILLGAGLTLPGAFLGAMIGNISDNWWGGYAGFVVGAYTGYVVGSSLGVYSLAREHKPNISFLGTLSAGIIGSGMGFGINIASGHKGVARVAPFILPIITSIVYTEYVDNSIK
jgi:hypothetical protein